MSGVHRNAHTRNGHLKIRKFKNLARLVAKLLFLIGFAATIVDKLPGERDHIVSNGGRKLFRRRKINR